jgi:plastocyanin
MRLAPASRLVVAVLLVATLPASGPLAKRAPHTLSSASSTLSGAAAQTQGIIITGTGADPQVVTITVGTAVEWRNQDKFCFQS